MRWIIPSSVALFAALSILSPAGAQCPAQVTACSADLAPGAPTYDDSISDLTYRAGLQQVWAIEGPLPSFNGLRTTRLTAFSEDLQTKLFSINANFTELAFGIAEIPDSLPEAGKCYVLAPAVTAGGPAIGIMEDNGSLVAGTGFVRVIDLVTGNPPAGYYKCIDVNPTQLEIALYDSDAGRIVFVAPPVGDGPFTVIRGPFQTVGLPGFFGGGITYDTESTVLVLSQFRSAFEGHLALQYDASTGVYTGSSIVLDHPESPVDDPRIPLGLDLGLLAGTPTLFFYNAFADAIYGVNPDQVDAPGPVEGVNPSCVVEPDGRVRLSWSNNPGHVYSRIRVLENGVAVAVLPATDTSFLTAVPPRGKYELCLETLDAGDQSVIRVCCEGQTGAQLPFLPPLEKPGSTVTVDPDPNVGHFMIGLAAPKVVAGKDAFKVYIIGSYDNQVRIVDYRRQSQPIATIPTSPLVLSTVSNGRLTDTAATGVALIDVVIQGITVPMYALLDGDGPNGNATPQASIHFLQDTLLPGSEAPITAGTRYKDEITLDMPGLEGAWMYDWDSDAAGDLIAVDYEKLEVIKFHYDPEANTIQAVNLAPLPIKDLPPAVDKNYGLGAITVLPSGYYLLAADQFFKTTVSRAFLLTPLDSDPSRSLKMIGPVDGLWTFSQFLTYTRLGRGQGPSISLGFTSTYFEAEDVGAMYYDLPRHDVTRRLYFSGNYLIGLTTSFAHPNLAAESFFDDTVSLGIGGSLDTGPLSPSFASQTPRIDYHYHIYNPSTAGNLNLKTHVFFDGVESPELGETINIPAGLGLYRVASDRAEKSIQVQVESVGASSPVIRVTVAATGVKATTGPKFRRGDADLNGLLEITDPLTILGYLFLSGPLSCVDAADVDDNSAIDLNDPVYVLNWMFLSGDPIPSPGPDACGPDPTVDALPDCVSTCQ